MVVGSSGLRFRDMRSGSIPWNSSITKLITLEPISQGLSPRVSDTDTCEDF